LAWAIIIELRDDCPVCLPEQGRKDSYHHSGDSMKNKIVRIFPVYCRTSLPGLVLSVVLCLFPQLVQGQASLFSVEAPYLRALELEGRLVRPFLTYRSLSDEDYTGLEGVDSSWYTLPRNLKYGSGPFGFELFLPDTFMSYNTAYPHGMNDGALWQGVGFNAITTGGFRLSVPGFSATFKPELFFAENRDFEIMPAVVSYPRDTDGFGYFWAVGMDVYQRPGQDALSDWTWGDSEIRFDWKTATIGFGTQAVWLGPGLSNAIILSNNAAPFPKLDFGIRKTATPIGFVEARAFWGKLTESQWFNKNPDDDHTLLTGLTVAWSPWFFPELTLGANRTMLSRWTDQDWGGMLELVIPIVDMGYDLRDQRASITGEMLYPTVGLRLWFEWARNDHNSKVDTIIRYPFHSQGYAWGLEKLWKLSDPDFSVMAEAEFANTESSRNYQVYSRSYSFYSHHIIRHGYTSEGQILGAGIGSGGNFQRMAFSLLHPFGLATAYVERRNRDNDYVYFLNNHLPLADRVAAGDKYKYNAELCLGLSTSWQVHGFGIAQLGLSFNANHNPLYNPADRSTSTKLYSTHIYSRIKLTL
jgi:hypothetical protein